MCIQPHSPRCIQRNPRKGIERFLWVDVDWLQKGLLLHSKKSQKGNWEKGCLSRRGRVGVCCCIQRNPRKGIERLARPESADVNVFTMLHSKKSQKGNWEADDLQILKKMAERGCIQRNPRKGIESATAPATAAHITPTPSCIQRNPRKGIESLPPAAVRRV